MGITQYVKIFKKKAKDKLPTEIIFNIVRTLSDDDLIHLASTCSRFFEICCIELNRKKILNGEVRFQIQLAIERPQLYNYLITSNYKNSLTFGIVPSVGRAFHLFAAIRNCFVTTKNVLEELAAYQSYGPQHFPHLIKYDAHQAYEPISEYTKFTYAEADKVASFHAICITFDGIPTPVFVTRVFGFMEFNIHRTYNVLSNRLPNRYAGSIFINDSKARSFFFSLMTYENILKERVLTKNECGWVIKYCNRSSTLPERRFVAPNYNLNANYKFDKGKMNILDPIAKRKHYDFLGLKLGLVFKNNDLDLVL